MPPSAVRDARTATDGMVQVIGAERAREALAQVSWARQTGHPTPRTVPWLIDTMGGGRWLVPRAWQSPDR